MRPKIYIDGSEGTTGLRIFERVGCRDDIEILTIDPASLRSAGSMVSISISSRQPTRSKMRRPVVPSLPSM